MSTNPPQGPAGPFVEMPDFHSAAARIDAEVEAIRRLLRDAMAQRDDARREREEALQEAGRLRARVEELEAAADDGIAYLLWSGAQGAWWAPDERGYTTDVDRAGRYSRTDAMRLVANSALCGVRERVTSMVAAPENWPVSDG